MARELERLDRSDLFSNSSLFQSLNKSSHSATSSLIPDKDDPNLTFLLSSFKGARMKTLLRLGGGEGDGEPSNKFSREEGVGQWTAFMRGRLGQLFSLGGKFWIGDDFVLSATEY